MSSELLQQIQQRRTFAIISHPDAGKDHHDRKAAAVW
jgi:peptide subunit release factor RF-3